MSSTSRKDTPPQSSSPSQISSPKKTTQMNNPTHMPHIKQEPPSSTENTHCRSRSSSRASTPSAVARNSRFNGIVLIPQLDIIDKELAYRQKLGRPFKVIQNLPVSNSQADYSLLNSALSVRDSGSLYNSLIVSRHNWLHNVFQPCWTRRDQYLASSKDRKRDRMSKLCDAKIQCGPHIFPIKLFILKDDKREKEHEEEIERKKEERRKRKEHKEQIKLEHKQEEGKIAESGKKMGAEDHEKRKVSINMSPALAKPGKHNVDEKDDPALKRRKVDERVQNGKERDVFVSKGCVKENSALKTASKENASNITSKGSTSRITSEENTLKITSKENISKIASKDNSLKPASKEKDSNDSSSQSPSQEKSNTAEKVGNFTKSEKDDPTKHNTNKETSRNNIKQKKDQPAGKQVKEGAATQSGQKSVSDSKQQKPSTHTLMSDPQNVIMIHNLNRMARNDPFLSKLMQVVAIGQASKPQVAKFQEFIQKAKDMGDVDGYLKKYEAEKKRKSAVKEISKEENDPKKKVTRRKSKEEKEKEKEQLRLEKQIRKQKQREERERLKMLEKEKRERERELKREQRRLERIKEKKEREKEREIREKERAEKRMLREKERLEKLKRKEQREREKMLKKERMALRHVQTEKERKLEEERQRKEALEGKLTSFQERYSSGATLVFEFHENTSARFYIPRDAIMEVLNEKNDENEAKKSSTEDRIGQNVIKTEPETEKVDGRKPYVDILVSFVLVHNIQEIEEWKERKRLRDTEKQKQQAETLKKRQEERLKLAELAEEKKKEAVAKKSSKKKRRHRKNWGSSRRKTRSSSIQQQERRLKKEAELSYKAENEEDEERMDPEPVPVYSTTTVTLKDVPAKFADLVKNSGETVQESRVSMEKMMECGQRLDQKHMWYQLDGVKDELLAETLRFNLNRLDYINGGGKLKGRAMLKRIVEKSGSDADVKIRRRRRN